MFKHLFISSLALTFAFAADMQTGVAALLKQKANLDIKVVKSLDVSNNLKFVIVQDANKSTQFPLLATANGDAIIAFSKEFATSKPDVENNIKKALEEMAIHNKQAQDKAANAMFAQIPNDGVLKLESGKSKTIVVISDPECPYCRKELENIDAKLNEANIYMVFAPVHGKSAFVKSDLIYQKAAKVKTVAEKVKIIKEYFNPNVKLSEKEMAMQPVITEKNAQIVFKSGVVQGVPFAFELKK